MLPTEGFVELSRRHFARSRYSARAIIIRDQYKILVIREDSMWHFAWILGVLLACAFGIVNVMGMEAEDMLDTPDGLES
jgi:cyd operon protein YbgT